MDDGWVSIFMMGLLIVVTIAYVIITERILDETRKQRLNASRPLPVPVDGRRGVARLYHIMTLDGGDDVLLHVRNIGLGPADLEYTR